jgi:hypothetical protein
MRWLFLTRLCAVITYKTKSCIIFDKVRKNGYVFAMKARSLMLGAVVAMATVLPAHANSGLIKVTHSDTPCKWASHGQAGSVAKAKSAQPAAKEIQVAVMAKSSVEKPPRRAVFIRR